MPFRFFRRKKIFPGVTLNISKKGISLSLGPRGFKLTIGKNGIRHSVGIPGTGLSHTKLHSSKIKKGKQQ